MKKGFTLVELLAIIVILGILTTLITPRILKVIEDSRYDAFQITVSSIIDSLKLDALEDTTSEIPVGTKTVMFQNSNLTGRKLSYSGKSPENGFIKLNDQGETELALTFRNYCAVKKYNESEITFSKDETNCTISCSSDCDYYKDVFKDIYNELFPTTNISILPNISEASFITYLDATYTTTTIDQFTINATGYSASLRKDINISFKRRSLSSDSELILLTDNLLKEYEEIILFSFDTKKTTGDIYDQLKDDNNEYVYWVFFIRDGVLNCETFKLPLPISDI